MSNLAVKYKKQQTKSHVPKQAPKTARKSQITLFEKIMYTAFVAFLLYACIAYIGNKAALYEVNTEASKLRQTIEEKKQFNHDLQAEVEKLSRYERIAKKAKEMGLEINENNVKGLNP
ncbi:MAG: cell division protein FtsL [Ectobacillus sp.]